MPRHPVEPEDPAQKFPSARLPKDFAFLVGVQRMDHPGFLRDHEQALSVRQNYKDRRPRRIRLVAWQGLAKSRAHLVNNSVTRLIDRCRQATTSRTSATFPSVATAQVADPTPGYDSSQPNATYGSTSVQWSGPSLYDYAWGVGDRTAGELFGHAGNTKKVRNESWAGCSTMSDV